MRLAEDALLHAGPPCNSFIWVSRGTTQRSKKNPEGDERAPSVQLGNLRLNGKHIGEFHRRKKDKVGWWRRCKNTYILCMPYGVSPGLVEFKKLHIQFVRFWQSISVIAAPPLRITSRLCLLLLICFARSVYFCVEQPRSSVMKHFKHLKELATMLSDLGDDVIKFRIQNLWLDKHSRISAKSCALCEPAFLFTLFPPVLGITELDGNLGTLRPQTFNLHGHSVQAPELLLVELHNLVLHWLPPCGTTGIGRGLENFIDAYLAKCRND